MDLPSCKRGRIARVNRGEMEMEMKETESLEQAAEGQKNSRGNESV